MRAKLTCSLLLALGLALLGPVPRAAAQFELSAEDLYVGTPVTVTLPQAAETLRVTYRPNSSISRTEILPTGGASTVEWTPLQPGVVSLAAGEATQQNVSVRFQKPPVSGIFVLLAAGAILFGGAIFAFVKLLRDEGPESFPERRPDT